MELEREPEGTGVSGAGEVSKETSPGTQQTTGTPSAEFETLKAKIAELEGRLAGLPSEDAIAEKVVQHPRVKQSQRDMITAQIQARTQELFEQLSQPIDELEADGALTDPAVAQRKRRDVFKRAKELAERELQTPSEQPSQAIDPGTEAQMLLADLGLTWADFPEWRSGQRVSITEIRRTAPLRAAQKHAAKIEAEKKTQWMTEYEAQVKAAQQSASAATPPPSGGEGGGNPLTKIEDRDELYRLARLEMDRAKR